MTLHDAIVKFKLHLLIAMSVASWSTKVGLSEEDMQALLHIKNNYVVLPKRKPDKLDDAYDVVDAANISNDPHEQVILVCADHDNQLLLSIRVAEGSRDAASVCIQRVLEYAHTIRACKAWLVHNHPRGGAVSPQDVSFTRQVREALALQKCILVDHYVVYTDHFTSILDGKEYKQERQA